MVSWGCYERVDGRRIGWRWEHVLIVENRKSVGLSSENGLAIGKASGSTAMEGDWTVESESGNLGFHCIADGRTHKASDRKRME